MAYTPEYNKNIRPMWAEFSPSCKWKDQLLTRRDTFQQYLYLHFLRLLILWYWLIQTTSSIPFYTLRCMLAQLGDWEIGSGLLWKRHFMLLLTQWRRTIDANENVADFLSTSWEIRLKLKRGDHIWAQIDKAPVTTSLFSKWVSGPDRIH